MDAWRAAFTAEYLAEIDRQLATMTHQEREQFMRWVVARKTP